MSTPTPYKVIERSIYSTKCFLENMKRTKSISHVEATILDKWYEWSVENADIKTDLICKYIHKYYLTKLAFSSSYH